MPLSRLLWTLTLWLSFTAGATESRQPLSDVAYASSERQSGNLHHALSLLRQAQAKVCSSPEATLIREQLGLAHLQAKQLTAAEEELLSAHRESSGTERARIANELGNLYLTRGVEDKARSYYAEAIESGAGTTVWFAARLNQIRMLPENERLAELSSVSKELEPLPEGSTKASLQLNLGEMALRLGDAGHKIAYLNLKAAASRSDQGSRLHIESLDSLSSLYEVAKRWDEAMLLAEQALASAALSDKAEDVKINLEWRLGRGFSAIGQKERALAAYQRAMFHVETLRKDMPLELPDGRSTYSALYSPLFLEFVSLQLDVLDGQNLLAQRENQPELYRTKNAIEFLRQAEMQDFLGDRCLDNETETEHRLDSGTALIYPIVLKDRLELLFELPDGLFRRRVPISSAQLTSQALTFASALRNGSDEYHGHAQTLYQWLIQPMMPKLEESKISTLIVVPDRELRLFPFAALHDGSRFLIEKLAIGYVTGIKMTNMSPQSRGKSSALLAGVAEPGPVVEKISMEDIMQSPGDPVRGGLSKSRSVQGKLRSSRITREAEHTSRELRLDIMRKTLALPGVKDEIQGLSQQMGGAALLDAEFTVGQFRDAMEEGSYSVVHVASHGVFGGSAESSYILAYDDVLGINRLQGLLGSQKFQKTPLELLTLSACETAEGNERAPLGIAGAAIRAKAKSVLGTLWPVEDTVARTTMESFYKEIKENGSSKAVALQKAQKQFIGSETYFHPFFWAPFSLIGNWRQIK